MCSMSSKICKECGHSCHCRDVCNTCLMNGCDNCTDRCVERNECNTSFKIMNKQVNTSNPVQVNFGSSEPQPNVVNPNDSYPGNKFVCKIDPFMSKSSMS